MLKFKKNSKNIFQIFQSPMNILFPISTQKKDILQSNSLIFKDHIDTTKTNLEKIRNEKRKRNQAYLSLDYILSLNTYFDFFSADAFQIAKDAKNFTQITNKKIVTSDLLLLPFFYVNSKISDIFQTYGISKENIEEIIYNYHNKSPENFAEQNISNLKNFFQDLLIYSPIQLSEIIPNSKIKYSLEINRIFEKAAENALKRFKTPVITTEILFITLMEEENTRAGKIIKKFFQNETDWFLLRYTLIKKLHRQESFIRTEISQNHHYFAYLLKTRFSDFDFENLIDNEYLAKAVLSFRNELIGDILQVDIYHLLEEEIYCSLEKDKKKNSRKYDGDL